MPLIATKTQQQMSQEILAAVAEELGVTPDWQAGSVIRALAEAVAAQDDYLQGLVNTVEAVTRLGTCTADADVDSFVADWGLTRIAAVAAQGQATFSLLAAKSYQVVVPTGTTVIQTPGGAVQYTVIADPTNLAYNAALNGYPIAAGLTTVIATVQANVAGTASNVQIGALTQFAAPVAGVDAVTNAAAISNGTDRETNAQLTARFSAFVGALARSTSGAIDYAIQTAQPGLRWGKFENVDALGNALNGSVLVAVDDGSGAPPTKVLDAVRTNIGLYRAFGVQYQVVGPTGQPMTITCSVKLRTGATTPSATVQAAVVAALTAYVNGLGFASTVTYSRLYQVAYDAHADVGDVTLMTLNGAAADIPMTFRQLPTVNTVTVTML